MNLKSDPNRLVIAARRTLRAEIILLLIIAVITTWSIYALYKLVSGDTGSVLGINFSKASLAQNPDSRNQQNLSATRGMILDSMASMPINNLIASYLSKNPPELKMSAGEQIANYKNQIVKELLARQRQIYNDLNEINRAPLVAVSKDHHQPVQKLNLEELKRWPGGFRLPSSLDNLFFTKPNTQDRKINSSLEPRNFRRGAQDNLKPIRGAPSLKLTIKSDDPTEKSNQDMEDNNYLEGDKEAEDSNLSSSDQEYSTGQVETTTRSSEESGETSDTTTEATPNGTETTTEEPASSEGSQTRADNDIGEENKTDSNEVDTPGDTNQDKSAANEEESDQIDDEYLQRVKKTVHSIDEEVDKMTQPSSGAVSQRDHPFDYKSVVQFDDNLGGITSSSTRHKLVEPTNGSSLIAQYSNSSLKSSIDRDHRLDGVDDLQVDHNKPLVSSDLEKYARTTHVAPLSTSNQTFTRGPPSLDRARKKQNKTGRFMQRMQRSIRSTGTETELAFFRPSINDLGTGKRQAIQERRNGDTVGDDGRNDGAVDEQDPVFKIQRRHYSNGQSSDYITSNGPSLHDLLAHKQLLDALQQSKLPPALVDVNSTQVSRSITKPDQQSATDSTYSIDHGLLLHPASDEEYSHGKHSKQGSKAMKKKNKKKMTAAIKKGGHKKKKHKKEEKNYHKEKKFKGAKKGKKMKKGKGGKGGKKGSKLFKDKGFKKKGFKNIYVKNEFGQKKSYFDEFRDKDFKKKWKNFDDKYNYAQMKKWQAKDMKGAKKKKDHSEQYKKYDKSKWKKKYMSDQKSEMKKKKMDEFN